VGRWAERERRSELVAAGALLARRGLIRAREGNLSCRLEDGRFLVTPRGADKGRLAAPDLVLVALDHALPEAASSEALMHLETYRLCPDVVAIVHAHPSNVLALDARGALPDLGGLKEGEAVVRAIGRVPALTPGTLELARACARVLRRSPVAVMARHGLIAVGRDLWEALARVETTELLAQVAVARRWGGFLQ
jgi:L-fuculose-phosphate aldolase